MNPSRPFHEFVSRRSTCHPAGQACRLPPPAHPLLLRWPPAQYVYTSGVFFVAVLSLSSIRHGPHHRRKQLYHLSSRVLSRRVILTAVRRVSSPPTPVAHPPGSLSMRPLARVTLGAERERASERANEPTRGSEEILINQLATAARARPTSSHTPSYRCTYRPCIRIPFPARAQVHRPLRVHSADLSIHVCTCTYTSAGSPSVRILLTTGSAALPILDNLRSPSPVSPLPLPLLYFYVYVCVDIYRWTCSAFVYMYVDLFTSIGCIYLRPSVGRSYTQGHS